VIDKNKTLKIGGTIATVLGAVALALSGTAETQVTAIVSAIFIAVGVIAAIFK
jgi:hypothetical protein